MRADRARAADLHGLDARGGAGHLQRRPGRRVRPLLRHAGAGADPAAGGPRHGPRLVRRPHHARAGKLRRGAGRARSTARWATSSGATARTAAKWRWGAAHFAHRRASAVRRGRPRSAPSSTSRCRAPAATTRSTAARRNSARSRPSPTATPRAIAPSTTSPISTRSLYIHTTGQSGNPLSPFYRSFAERWAKGDYIEIADQARGHRQGAARHLEAHAQVTPRKCSSGTHGARR